MSYTKPMVTIELKEYNELLLKAKRYTDKPELEVILELLVSRGDSQAASRRLEEKNIQLLVISPMDKQLTTENILIKRL